ncbi:tetratricopeptide repeat protein, partial [Corallococcus exercitus]|uniref:tetratricopeptide repeat protein n=1 Tax=Corallococcus exercitus TaxID=2316736 RepID=UPI0034DE6691
MEPRALKDKATEAFSKGRFAKAAELYADYCQADPKDHQSRLRMGDAWAKAGQRDRAVSAYQSAAEGFAKEGFLPRAIAASKLILELDPSHQGVQQMLADLYARRGTPATSRAKPKEATASPTPASLITQREAPPTPTPAAPLEAEGVPVDLSDSLPPELALTHAPATAPRPVADDTEVVISVEVQVEPTQDEPAWDLTPEAPAQPEPAATAAEAPTPAPTASNALPAPTHSPPPSASQAEAAAPDQSVRVAPPRPPPSPS